MFAGFFVSVLPAQSAAISLAINPNVGTTSTHFFVSGSGLDAPPKPCPTECMVFANVFLDGTTLIYSPECAEGSTGFSIDLQNVPGRGCVVCALAPGVHTIEFNGATDCMGDPLP